MKLKDFKLGATGRHPYGRVSADDEGELAIALATDHGNGIVRIEFGTTITWLGLPSAQARQLAQMLIEKADELDRRKA